MRFTWMAWVVGLTIAGCAPQPSVTPAPRVISFADRTPIKLDVSSIQVVNEYAVLEDNKGAEGDFPVPPSAAVERWASDRLKPVRPEGEAGTVRVIIKEASVKAVDLPQTTGIRGFFTTDQILRYEGTISVEIIAEDRDRRINGVSEARVRRTTSVPENANAQQKENIQYTLVKDMMTDLDVQLEQGIQLYLKPFLR